MSKIAHEGIFGKNQRLSSHFSVIKRNFESKLVPYFMCLDSNGQLILKCLFGVFDFFQKTNENKSTRGIKVVESNLFVRFLEELGILKSPIEITDL